MMRRCCLSKEERWPALYALVFILSYQYLIISKFFRLFADFSEHNWNMFLRNYHMSGFDPITYDVLSDWSLRYNVVRHPLLALAMYPLSLLNHLLEQLTNVNCAQLIMGTLLTVCAFLAFLFFYRILRKVIGISHLSSFLLTVFFFSFAYIWVSTLVADHFGLSLFLLIYLLYRSGIKLKNNERFCIWETILYFVVVAGVTLSNGVIVFLCVWVVNGRQFFQPSFLLKTVVIPSVCLLSFAYLLNLTIDKAPSEKENPISEQMEWVGTKVSWTDILVENYFGESIQLHRQNILGDVLIKRPVVVRYTWPMQYVVEAVIILLFFWGAWQGRRERFLWLLMGILAFNILLHVVIGFGIEEVYIMAAHWLFVIPLSIAWLFTTRRRWLYLSLLMLIGVITAYLLIYHGYWLHYYLTWPLVK